MIGIAGVRGMKSPDMADDKQTDYSIDDTQSGEAFVAIGLYIKRFFDSEKINKLFRLAGSTEYLRMQERISELESALRWIPVEHRLPDYDPEWDDPSTSGPVEVLRENEIISPVRCFLRDINHPNPKFAFSRGEWIGQVGRIKGVTHWRYMYIKINGDKR